MHGYTITEEDIRFGLRVLAVLILLGLVVLANLWLRYEFEEPNDRMWIDIFCLILFVLFLWVLGLLPPFMSF